MEKEPVESLRIACNRAMFHAHEAVNASRQADKDRAIMALEHAHSWRREAKRLQQWNKSELNRDFDDLISD